MPDKVNLEEIRERERKATKGPWTNFPSNNRGVVISGVDGIVMDIYSGTDDSGHLNMKIDDGYFIAHARQDIPDLLGVVEEAREIILRYKSHAIDVVIIDPQAEVWLGKAGK